MSGVEALGIVLGVLPLLISAAEHWDNVLRPFKRYRKFAPELDEFQQQLKTQKTIFRNECCLLLSVLASHDTAKYMLQQPRHPLWMDKEFDNNFALQLGDSGEACESTIIAIKLKLKELEAKAENFGTILQQIPVSTFTPVTSVTADIRKLASVGDKSWRSRLAKKLKFAFSESRIESLLNELRNLNRDFLTLSAQTSRLKTKQIEVTHSRPPPAMKEKIEGFQNVHKAFIQLYNALGKACQLHEEHSAHFSLEPQHIRAIGSEPPLVRFNVAFTHIMGNNMASINPVWIAIDSIFGESATMEDSFQQPDYHGLAKRVLGGLSSTPKRTHGLSNETLNSNTSPPKKKRVAFATTTAEKIQPSAFVSASSLLLNTPTDITLPDFCVQHNFCICIQKCSQQRQTKIGYLEKAGPCKHLVYFSPSIVACQAREPMSLAYVVSSISKKCEMQKLLQYQRLRLAKQLAAAVLQFHGTPLMKDSWQSKDVVFFDSSEDFKQQSNALHSPHLNVHVQKSQQSSLISDTCSPSNQGLIRNSYLFNLGVVLLELAYQAPLRSLQEASDLKDGFDRKHIEFFAANRLSNNMKPVLGLTYANIVKKCLACDFGHGDDLNDSMLQAVFYRDVVCELERLENMFSKLQLSD
jgi:hypothetical protein